MARNNARWGRLHRVLNHESAIAGDNARDNSAHEPPGDTPRYGAGANIENHPQITDYVPRKFRSMALLVMPGLALVGLAEYAAHHPTFANMIDPSWDRRDLAELAARTSAWTAAAALLVAAAYAHLVFLLKRHRLDDAKGRYRSWRTGMLLAWALSFDSVVGLHSVVARALGNLTGFHPLQDTGWWLLPTAAIVALVLSRMMLSTAECRSALVSFLLAAGMFGVSGVLATGGWGLVSAELQTVLLRCLPAVGAVFTLLGCLLMSRYVVLDVQGLIEHQEDVTTPSAPFTHCGPEEESSMERDEVANRSETQWTDGSEPDSDYCENKPLSKAERKRLRKQQRRHAA